MSKRMFWRVVAVICISTLAPTRASDQAIAQTTAQWSASSQYTSSDTCKYIGNSWSRKFHLPNCPFAKEMTPSRRMKFADRAMAVQAGHAPCKYCLPASWKSVEGRVIEPSKPGWSHYDSAPKTPQELRATAGSLEAKSR